MAESSTKFIERNRAPRVHIEYEVENYGSKQKVSLPFIMGVLSDLSGKPAEPLPTVADRKFLEIDNENFNDRLKAMKPRVAFRVENTLSGEGNLNVDITFENLDDFSPDALVKKIPGVQELFKARSELANLQTYLDGKANVEELVSKIIQDPALLQSLTTSAKPEDTQANPTAESGE